MSPDLNTERRLTQEGDRRLAQEVETSEIQENAATNREGSRGE